MNVHHLHALLRGWKLIIYNLSFRLLASSNGHSKSQKGERIFHAYFLKLMKKQRRVDGRWWGTMWCLSCLYSRLLPSSSSYSGIEWNKRIKYVYIYTHGDIHHTENQYHVANMISFLGIYSLHNKRNHITCPDDHKMISYDNHHECDRWKTERTVEKMVNINQVT